MIIGGGSNAYEREVEEALLGLDGIAEAATGLPHPKWGERVATALVSGSGEPPPTNGYGKAFKRDLCDRCAQVP